MAYELLLEIVSPTRSGEGMFVTYPCLIYALDADARQRCHLDVLEASVAATVPLCGSDTSKLGTCILDQGYCAAVGRARDNAPWSEVRDSLNAAFSDLEGEGEGEESQLKGSSEVASWLRCAKLPWRGGVAPLWVSQLMLFGLRARSPNREPRCGRSRGGRVYASQVLEWRPKRRGKKRGCGYSP